MTRNIAVIQGHPDPSPERLCRALAGAYASGAAAAGRNVRTIDVATLDFPLLRSQAAFESGVAPPAIAEAQETLRWADHWVIVYPLWLGDAPALFKGFIEQAFRPGFALRYRPGKLPEGLLKGKSARVIVTMGMPSLVYRFFFFAHGLRNLERNVLAYAGIAPVRATLIGSAKGMSREAAQRWLSKVEALGREGR
ncbi:NAD(P)H-dependent oxidoreductase [Methylocystis parvus]|uniref:NAD(P)H-dependent oxidoreductase n=1 Tax=Methylocystis parvus TaxID=134 RepID=A0A6B8M956_9HYPH|nr:NAD(P)H-dependent oxidoreductase [Methylocystis parvus]QGM98935.1 NAD(P)H-dependent oxidoreductase [Methylocystis parvus]WBK00709.1 NAD(P)H-dependent oxidoreductase [Methylocystis parvus OBBP]